RYQRDGQEHQLGLGPTYLVTLKEAREKAVEAKRKLLDGIDPLQEKRDERAAASVAAAKAMTFEAAARSYFDDHEKKWRNKKHRDQFLSLMKRYVFPLIANLPVSAIDTALVLKVLEQKHEDYPDEKLWTAIPQSAEPGARSDRECSRLGAS